MSAKKIITDEEFTTAWQSADSVSDVAKKLDITYTTASARGTRLRKAGVQLKVMQRGRGTARNVDVDGLNKLIGAKGGAKPAAKPAKAKAKKSRSKKG